MKLKGTLVVGEGRGSLHGGNTCSVTGQFRNAIQFNQGKKDVVMVQ